MRCRAARKLLSRRLDGRLAPAGAAILREHLARCPACALASARLDRAWRRLGALAAAAGAPDDFAGVLERAAAAARPGRRTAWREWLAGLRPRQAWALAVAASLVAGVTTGTTLGRAAFGARRASAAPEALALSDGFGLLPFASPAAGLAGALAGASEASE